MVGVGELRKSDNPIYCISLELERLVKPNGELKQKCKNISDT